MLLPTMPSREIARARLVAGLTCRTADRPALRLARVSEVLESVEVQEDRGVVLLALVDGAAAAQLALRALV
jgi:hypothetical protein